MRSRGVESWLAGLPVQDGFPLGSPARRFGGGEGHEDEYVRQFVVDDAYETGLAKGLARVLQDAEAMLAGPALELGCGTGILTRPLVRLPFESFVITDMSPVFLDATRDSLPPTAAPVHFVVLDTADIERVPPGTFSLIALRYVLHHVLDWREFLRVAATRLRPGGVLLFEEPCSDGFLLQLIAIEVAQRAHETQLSEEVRGELQFFRDTLNFYLRTDIDKAEAEDKHLFRDSTVITLLRDAGLRTRVYPNAGLDALGPGIRVGPEYFLHEFRHNLSGNFGFGEETLAFFDDHVGPALGTLGTLSSDEMGPFVKALFVARRPRHASVEAGKAVLRGQPRAQYAARRGYRWLVALRARPHAG